MTTIAMGAGMMPLALGWGVDSSFGSPMAIAVIGGLITSTLLSLLVVPAVFTIVGDFEHVLRRQLKRRRKQKPVAAKPAALAELIISGRETWARTVKCGLFSGTTYSAGHVCSIGILSLVRTLPNR